MRFWARPALALTLAASLAGCGGAHPRRASSRPAAQERPSGPGIDRDRIADQASRTAYSQKGGWSLTTDKVRDVAPLVARAADANRLPPDLIYGIIWVESRFNPKAVSPVGAGGLMQLMPRTARYLAECIDWKGRPNAFDAEFNIAAGSYYIARLIQNFGGDEDLALAAYNAGPENVRRWRSGSGLPEVSVEYVTMVQTARSFFADRMRPAEPGVSRPGGVAPAPEITDGDLDRLGLAILIAGLGEARFGLDRPDSDHPFD